VTENEDVRTTLTGLRDDALQRAIQLASEESLRQMTVDQKWAQIDQLLSGRMVVSFDDQSAIMKLIESDPQAILRRMADRGALTRLVERVDDHFRRWLPFQLIYSFPRTTLAEVQLWSRRLKSALVTAARADSFIADMALKGVEDADKSIVGAKFRELAVALGAKSRPTIDFSNDRYERSSS
jgi:hypothetical protein